MSGSAEPNPQELADSRDARIAIRRLNQQERYVAMLRQAVHQRIGEIDRRDNLLEAIKDGEVELQRLRSLSGGRIVARRRPKKAVDNLATTCTVYIDECGSHNLTRDREFQAFVLAAVIVPDDEYLRLESQWRDWKETNLGAASKLVHEPDVRRGRGSFWFEGNAVKQSEARDSLQECLDELQFHALVCVINRPAYLEEIGVQALDESLPAHPYLMTLDFLMERLVMILDTQFNGARASVVAEARGTMDDALLQQEYVRLLVDGTSYVSNAWFRQQLAPGIEFQRKEDNVAGLELADLLARPCGEKVLAPETTPDRWLSFRAKLCQGQETKHSVLGIKIIPWDERYEDIWTS